MGGVDGVGGRPPVVIVDGQGVYRRNNDRESTITSLAIASLTIMVVGVVVGSEFIFTVGVVGIALTLLFWTALDSDPYSPGGGVHIHNHYGYRRHLYVGPLSYFNPWSYAIFNSRPRAFDFSSSSDLEARRVSVGRGAPSGSGRAFANAFSGASSSSSGAGYPPARVSVATGAPSSGYGSSLASAFSGLGSSFSRAGGSSSGLSAFSSFARAPVGSGGVTAFR